MDKPTSMIRLSSGMVRFQSGDILIRTQSLLTGGFKRLGDQIFEWSADTGIQVDFISKWWCLNSDISSWRINSQEDRMLFLLKFGGMIATDQHQEISVYELDAICAELPLIESV